MEERAALTEFAISTFEEVLARHGLIVGVDGTKGGLSEVVWKWLYEKFKIRYFRYLRRLAV
jgi:hypothetical protein